MTDKKTVEQIVGSLRRLGRVDAPAVERLDLEIRSGDKVLLRDPLGAAAGAPDAMKNALAALGLGAVGAIVVEWGYDVRRSRIEEFQKWLIANEPALLGYNAGGDANVRYRGTFAVFSSTEKATGQFRTIWTYKRFSDLDKMSKEFEDNTPFAKLVKDLRDFFDHRSQAGSSQQIYLLANAARIGVN